MSEQVGTIKALAVRTARNGAMQELDAARVTTSGGLEGDLEASPARGVTFLSTRQWADVNAELQADLPWHTRRANVLVDSGALGHLIGKTISVGKVRIAIKGETDPCGLMDQLHDGLRAALSPDCRGGVYGQVLDDGEFRVGDRVEVVAD